MSKLSNGFLENCKKTIPLLLFSILISLTSFAQEKIVVRGTVVDENNQPVPAVSISSKGLNKGVTTDANGAFSISVNVGATLVISHVSYDTKEIVVNRNNMVLNISLVPKAGGLSDIVVIGYGSVKRKELTGSVTTIKMENSPVALLPNLNALENLKGNVAGLNIGVVNEAGGQPSVLIRGQRSISGNNDPLILLDGVIYLGSLGDINPNDIASYDILKDAISAAAYGSRSANGIIAITTKKGKLGKPVISLKSERSYQSWQNQVKLMSGSEWLATENARTQSAPGNTNFLTPAVLDNYKNNRETDWVDLATHTGIIQSYQASVSGAGQGTNYYLSGSYDKNDGIVKGDDFNRISIFTKVNTKVTSWLEMGIDANYSKRDYSGVAANLFFAQIMSPYGVPYRDSLKNLEKYPVEQTDINPLWGVDDGTRYNKRIVSNFRLNTYGVVTIPFVKGLSYRVNLLSNLDKDNEKNFNFENFYIKNGAGIAGRYDPASVQGLLGSANGNVNDQSASSYVLDNIINYERTFGKHRVYTTLVATRDHYKLEQVVTSGSDFSVNGNTTLGVNGLSKAVVQKVVQNNLERSNVGYLARINYSYNEKYFLSGSIRRDGASVFGQEKRYANFGAVGAAWTISKEAFLKDFKPLNNLKLKFSVGQNGNQGLGPYATLSQIANSASGGLRYEFSNTGSNIYYGLVQTSLGNPSLGWEKTTATNLGMESAWLKDRLFVDLDLYISKTTDQIFVRNIPIFTGFSQQLASLGQVNNRGLELTVRTVNIESKNVNWSTGITFWKNANKLVHLYNEDKNGDGKEDDDIANGFFIGKSLGAIYGFKQNGIVQTGDTAYTRMTGAAPGAPKYYDLDSNNKIDGNDRTILGYTKENFRLNVSNTFSYKNLQLYVMVGGIFGGNNTYLKADPFSYLTNASGRGGDNSLLKPYWTPQNNSNEYPSAYFAGDGRFQGLRSRTFVRIQDISLSYSIKSKWLSKAHFKSLQVYGAVKNAATFTNWIGGDPETGATIFGGQYGGQNPVPTSYTAGVNISF